MFSLTYSGAIVMGLTFLAKWADINVAEAQLQSSVEGVVFLIGFLVTCYGRFRAGGIKWFGKKI
jgi:hypothetical protein